MYPRRRVVEILDDLLNDDNDDGWIDELLGEEDSVVDPAVVFSGKSPREIQEIADRHSGVDSVVAPKKKGKRVVYSVACTLHLSGSDYQVQLLPESSEYDKAYRLNKINAQKPTGYNVTQVDGEILCECSDFKYRQEGAAGKGCKHIRGLVDLGMFSSPAVSHRQGASVFDD
jgi:hypothetical protein